MSKVTQAWRDMNVDAVSNLVNWQHPQKPENWKEVVGGKDVFRERDW